MEVALYELRGSRMETLNNAVTAFQKEFHAKMKNMGYERKTSTQSALYNWEYTKGARRITIDGWHGTGKPGTSRFYGACKSFHSLYDSAVPGYQPVVNAPTGSPAGQLDSLYERQFAAMKEALAYIAAKA